MTRKSKHAAITRIPKVQVAKELLDSGLQMYFAKNYFAAIQLAGAAEEILGAFMLRWTEETPAAVEIHNLAVRALGYELHQAPKSVSTELYRLIHHARNCTKHVNAEGDTEITFDPADKARHLLDRALSNYYALAPEVDLRPTRRVHRFNKERFS